MDRLVLRHRGGLHNGSLPMLSVPEGVTEFDLTYYTADGEVARSEHLYVHCNGIVYPWPEQTETKAA